MIRAFSVRPVAAPETHGLRQAVLRPHQPVAEMPLPGDTDPEALHAGAFAADALVGVGSVFPDPEGGAALWRLRGMATAPGWRGQGAGKAVLQALLAHAWAAGGQRVWCNARTPAAGFYLQAGFTQRGDVFELPGIGPHVVMEINRP